MPSSTVGGVVTESVAEEIADLPFVESAVSAVNHKGPYVEATVTTEHDRERMWDCVDDYPCYIDIVTADE